MLLLNTQAIKAVGKGDVVKGSFAISVLIRALGFVRVMVSCNGVMYRRHVLVSCNGVMYQRHVMGSYNGVM